MGNAFLSGPRRIVVVGGGYSGATAAVQLVRASRAPLAITIVEPRAEVGRGMAYTADDPDHRLNGPLDNHMVDPLDTDALRRWCEATGVLARDPQAMSANGSVFIRRHDFGRFVAETVKAHADWPATGSTIRHRRDLAIDADVDAGSLAVRTAAGASLAAELVVVATGNARPRLPAALAPELAAHPGVIADPGDLERLRALPRDARVLILGSGLTALDIVSTLVRLRHRGAITVVSRRGLRPRPHRLAAPPAAGPTLFERIEGPLPDFVRAAGSPPTVRSLLHALRARIAAVEREGGEWQSAFDQLRDVVWQFWPKVAPAEKVRFQRWLRAWYDVHRFRAPPQNDAIVRAAERQGRVSFRVVSATARIQAAASALRLDSRLRGNDGNGGNDGNDGNGGNGGNGVKDEFDALINCTGLDPAAGARDNAFLAALLERGILTVDPSGIGFAVDGQCRPIGRDAAAHPRLRLIGPPTAGTFGDPLGVPFIAPQIRRILAGMLATLEQPPAPCA